MPKSMLTKTAFAESLKKLASERLFEQITVGDIVKECGMNRQSFYYHFSDKYELLDWIYYNETFVPLTADISFRNWDEKFYELLRIMKSNKSFYMNTIKCSNNFFEEYMLKALHVLLLTAIDVLDVTGSLSQEKKTFTARVFSYGLTGVVMEWAMSGMKEDAGQMARDMKELVDNVEQMAYRIYHYKQGDSTEEESRKIAEIFTSTYQEAHKTQEDVT